jgi:hypothetical protein
MSSKAERVLAALLIDLWLAPRWLRWGRRGNGALARHGYDVWWEFVVGHRPRRSASAEIFQLLRLQRATGMFTHERAAFRERHVRSWRGISGD